LLPCTSAGFEGCGEKSGVGVSCASLRTVIFGMRNAKFSLSSSEKAESSFVILFSEYFRKRRKFSVMVRVEVFQKMQLLLALTINLRNEIEILGD
ncbi:hypothetical protein, partial [Nostoc sp. UHCC 0251]|uniref:hypothetical protein n=1 Tax=Nostoc sp. UHCC 0251 TaxID=3110240 RepID=UPI002B20B8D0